MGIPHLYLTRKQHKKEIRRETTHTSKQMSEKTFIADYKIASKSGNIILNTLYKSFGTKYK